MTSSPYINTRDFFPTSRAFGVRSWSSEAANEHGRARDLESSVPGVACTSIANQRRRGPPCTPPSAGSGPKREGDGARFGEAPLGPARPGGGRRREGVGGEVRRQSGTCWTLSLCAPPTGMMTMARVSDTRMMKRPRARCGGRGPERDRAAELRNGGRPVYSVSAGPEYVNGFIRNAIICGQEDDSGVSLFLHVCQGLFLFSSYYTGYC